uniref:U3 small nucleolar RNA-interacting protein 2 n=1 Tax=Esox lucius TaxID=8010 RepID=A0A6Q2ZQZ4_ESOLU
MSSFFIKKKGPQKVFKKSDLPGSKRKNDGSTGNKLQKKLTSKHNEEISSDSETESPAVHRKRRANVEEEFDETPQEKKLRLAKLYLDQLRNEEEKKAEEESFESELIAGRLEEDVVSVPAPAFPSNMLVYPLLQIKLICLKWTARRNCILYEMHHSQIAYSCILPLSFEGDVESGKRLHTIAGGRKGTEDRHLGHTAHILCMSISSDGKYLATGDMNKLILIWEAATCKHLYKFTGHRGPVSGLSFRRGTHDLYSASHDRSIKVWNVDENAYVETLFGHQDVITGLDSGSRERCVTAGGRDRTVRVWKIAEESQLVFHGHDGSIDCIQLINEEHMITGSDDGSVSLWNVNKKKPLSTVKAAHGQHGDMGLEQPYWVSAVAALHNSDTVASGSHNSKVQLWKCGQGFRRLEPLFSVPVNGFVNSLKFSSSGKFLVAGVGQEHRYVSAIRRLPRP